MRTMDEFLLYVAILIVGALVIWTLVVMWRVFEKAGYSGWKSLVPFYNTFIYFQICGMAGGYVFVLILLVLSELIIPIVPQLIELVIWCYSGYKIGKMFGVPKVMCVCNAIPCINYISLLVTLSMIAFGDYTWCDPSCIEAADDDVDNIAQEN